MALSYHRTDPASNYLPSRTTTTGTTTGTAAGTTTGTTTCTTTACIRVGTVSLVLRSAFRPAGQSIGVRYLEFEILNRRADRESHGGISRAVEGSPSQPQKDRVQLIQESRVSVD